MKLRESQDYLLKPGNVLSVVMALTVFPFGLLALILVVVTQSRWPLGLMLIPFAIYFQYLLNYHFGNGVAWITKLVHFAVPKLATKRNQEPSALFRYRQFGFSDHDLVTGWRLRSILSDSKNAKLNIKADIHAHLEKMTDVGRVILLHSLEDIAGELSLFRENEFEKAAIELSGFKSVDTVLKLFLNILHESRYFEVTILQYVTQTSMFRRWSRETHHVAGYCVKVLDESKTELAYKVLKLDSSSALGQAKESRDSGGERSWTSRTDVMELLDGINETPGEQALELLETTQ